MSLRAIEIESFGTPSINAHEDHLAGARAEIFGKPPIMQVAENTAPEAPRSWNPVRNFLDDTIGRAFDMWLQSQKASVDAFKKKD